MPSLLSPAYSAVIQSLPVLQHSVQVDSAFWHPKFAAAGQLPLWSAIFAGLPTIRISRNRLLTFAYPSPEQKTAEILLWGYPSDMHGIPSRLLFHLAVLSQRSASVAAWPAYYASMRAIPEKINISTITKLAHFHGCTFGGLQALILDNRLIGSTANWVETSPLGLSYQNSRSRYLNYLNVMHSVSANPALACTPDQLEFFLFVLGESF
jgi:hypothetical protein